LQQECVFESEKHTPLALLKKGLRGALFPHPTVQLSCHLMLVQHGQIRAQNSAITRIERQIPVNNPVFVLVLV